MGNRESDAVKDLEARIAAAKSIYCLLDHHAKEQPDAVALACSSAQSPWIHATWSRFADDTRRAAAGLRDLGVASGDHVAILLDNRRAYEAFVANVALLRCAAVMVPLNPRSTISELSYALGAADCRWLIAGAEILENVEAARSQTTVRPIGVDGVHPGWADWREVVSHPAGEATIGSFATDDLARILFTSGTTARPKGVMHTHRTGVATGATLATGLGLRSADVLHHPAPFFTSSGAQATLNAMLWAGCAMVVEPVFDAMRMVQRMIDEGTTVAVGAPAHFRFMLEALRNRKAELARVRLWDYGGAPMPAETIKALAEAFPAADQRQNYGSTETGPGGTILSPEFTFSKAGSVGRPMPLYETMVIDEAGRTLPVDEVGQICVRGPGCMIGYYKDPEATAAALVEGWVRTGDLGRKDGEGFLYYVDRLKDVINRGGLKISSLEIEEALYRHPGILEAAVVAVPHQALGEDIRAFVVVRAGVTIVADDLRDHCALHLARHKVPRDIRIVEGLPHNTFGKILKSELRQAV